MRFLLSLGLICLGLSASQPALAQRGRPSRHFNSQGRPYYRGPLRVVLGGGTAFYNGDLGGVGENFFGPALSLGVLYRLRPHLLIGGEFSYVEMGALDRLKERSLAFYSTNGMLTSFLRFDLLPDESAFVSTRADTPAFQVYLQAGGGALLYNPQSYFGTKRPSNGTVYLAPERNDYPAMALVAPVGGGLSIRLSDQFRVGLEGNYYFTTTDHLDDVSRRGNPDENDGFGTVLLKLDYSISQ
jgi:hypothetical protein